jgi:hypothetical protein
MFATSRLQDTFFPQAVPFQAEAEDRAASGCPNAVVAH